MIYERTAAVVCGVGVKLGYQGSGVVVYSVVRWCGKSPFNCGELVTHIVTCSVWFASMPSNQPTEVMSNKV